jgi:membrane-associated protease RseP (regulator of RpoE activity)
MRSRLAFIFAMLASAPVHPAPPDYAYLVRAWQGHDARLLTIGHRLATANAPLCQRVQNSVGLMLTDFSNFAKPQLARAVLGMKGEVAVEAVALGSAAEAAGLRAGDEVLAIGGSGVSEPRDRLDRLYTRLDSTSIVTIRTVRPGEAPRDVTLSGKPACRSRFALTASGTVAKADGLKIEIALPLFAEFTTDDEAAFIVAHELAHNILGHNQRASGQRSNYLAIRRYESEADRLAPWLMANAGYDPAAAPRFMANWGERHDQGITRAPTHQGYRQRMSAIAAEMPKITAVLNQKPGALLDWRVHFPNQTGE